MMVIGLCPCPCDFICWWNRHGDVHLILVTIVCVFFSVYSFAQVHVEGYREYRFALESPIPVHSSNAQDMAERGCIERAV